MRCIVHVDLDCFYAQVEAVRLGVPESTPFAVSQWGNLIAVNYPARAFGIGRFDSLTEARCKCPLLQSGHVATYAEGERQYAYHPECEVRKSTHKVSLEPYRDASKKIFAIFQSFSDAGVQVEKGGIDEAFLDVTVAAEARAAAEGCASGGLMADSVVAPSAEDGLLQSVLGFTRVIERLPPTDEDGKTMILHNAGAGWVDPVVSSMSLRDVQLLLHACAITQEIRAAVYNKLQYRCSAGIAHSKQLAKLISATHKPNQQTLLLPSRTMDYLVHVPFQKLRGFGGKLGESIFAHYGVKTCGELWRFPLQDLESLLKNKEDALVTFRQLRGGEGGEIGERTLPKSFLAEKVFAPPARNAASLQKWVVVLAHEIVERCTAFFQDHQMRPNHLTVHFGSRGLGGTGDVLRRVLPMPWPLDESKMVANVTKLSATVFSQTPNLAINCVLLGASDLVKETSEPQTLSQVWGQRAAKRPRETAEETSRDVIVVSSDDDDTVDTASL